jgi:hypothetical protein
MSKRDEWYPVEAQGMRRQIVLKAESIWKQIQVPANKGIKAF